MAGGSCLPLSTDVPLLPIATLLRATYDADHGQWLKEALTDAAPYVSASLRRLLPELDLIVDAPAEPDDEWSRQRLFTAVGSTLAGLAALRPLAVVIEDLHWADAMTLDLLEHLLTTGPGRARRRHLAPGRPDRPEADPRLVRPGTPAARRGRARAGPADPRRHGGAAERC